MIRALALSAILATPAFAADRAAWGTSPDPDRNTSATLAPADGPAMATVTIRNQLTAGHGATTSAILELPGMQVRVTVQHGAGDTPDRLTVEVPDGLIAVPPQIDVQEGESGVVSIYSATGAGA